MRFAGLREGADGIVVKARIPLPVGDDAGVALAAVGPVGDIVDQVAADVGADGGRLPLDHELVGALEGAAQPGNQGRTAIPKTDQVAFICGGVDQEGIVLGAVLGKDEALPVKRCALEAGIDLDAAVLTREPGR